MKRKSIKLGAAALFIATAAFANSGVKDHQVMARMNGMTDIAEDTKRLSTFANGAQAFVSADVQAIGQSLSEHADQTLRLFKPPASDPKSEAKSDI